MPLAWMISSGFGGQMASCAPPVRLRVVGGLVMAVGVAELVVRVFP